MQGKLSLTTIVSLSLVALACAKKPPEVPQIDEPEPPPPVVNEEPKQPTCDNIDKPCTVKDGEQVTFADGTLSFQPPAGWSYASVDQGVVTFSEDRGAVVTFLVTETELSAKSKAKQLLAALEPLLTKANVSGISEKALAKRLQDSPVVEKVGELELNTWQTPAKVNDQDGLALLILSQLPSGKNLIGVVALNKDAVANHKDEVRDTYHSLKGAQ